jgi:hypothetical protein
VAPALPRQLRQFTQQFKPDVFMALGARRKSLSANQSDLMGQAVLRVDYAVDPALGDRVRALIEICHAGCAPEKRIAFRDFLLKVIDARPID